MLFLFVVVAASFAALGGVASLRRRLREATPPSPSLRTRAWIVAGVTVAAITLHLASWLPLRPTVPPNVSPGSILYGGPGDGLWFLVVLLGWVCMQPVNVLLACFCSRSLKQAALVSGVLLGAWMGTAALGASLTRCPAGFVCRGG